MGTWQPPPRRLSSARSQVVHAGGSVVQECQELARSRVAFADFDAERSLPGSRAHGFGRDNLLDQFRLPQTLQSR